MSRKAAVTIVKVPDAVKRMAQINPEIRYASCIEQERFTTGLIGFRARRKADSKQIHHDDKDVVCHVLKGRGRLRIDGRRIPLRPGIVCHIPKRTPHDFAAGNGGELILLYSLIKTA